MLRPWMRAGPTRSSRASRSRVTGDRERPERRLARLRVGSRRQRQLRDARPERDLSTRRSPSRARTRSRYARRDPGDLSDRRHGDGERHGHLRQPVRPHEEPRHEEGGRGRALQELEQAEKAAAKGKTKDHDEKLEEYRKKLDQETGKAVSATSAARLKSLSLLPLSLTQTSGGVRPRRRHREPAALSRRRRRRPCEGAARVPPAPGASESARAPEAADLPRRWRPLPRRPRLREGVSTTRARRASVRFDSRATRPIRSSGASWRAIPEGVTASRRASSARRSVCAGAAPSSRRMARSLSPRPW